MLSLIKKNWTSFAARPDYWFFCLFLITSTLSIRKVLYHLPIDNSFNEYLGVYIYLSDIFLILTFISFILCNNTYILSNIRHFLAKYNPLLKMFHVEHLIKNINQVCKCSTWNIFQKPPTIVPRGTFLLPRKSYAQFIHNYSNIFPLFIAFFSFITILWTTNGIIALFRSIKILEYVLLYYYLIANVPRGTFLKKDPPGNELFHVEQLDSETTPASKKESLDKSILLNCSTWNNYSRKYNVPRGTLLENILIITFTVGIIQSIIGIAQVVIQHSVGLFLLKESLISPQIPGVAKIIFQDAAYIRAYGLFPHPNIFGGYLMFSILSSLLYFKLFHVEQFRKREEGGYLSQTKCSTWNILKEKLTNIVPRGTISCRFIIGIQSIALVLTFSKSAIIGLLLGLFYINYQIHGHNVPRGTFIGNMLAAFKMFHVEHFKRKTILILGIIVLLFITLKPNIESLLIKSLSERATYLTISREALLANPLFGIGIGQFVPKMANDYEMPTWQYQPVHNVYLLIANEYGIFVLIAFLFYLYLLFKDRKCSTWNISADSINATALSYLRGALLALVFIMLFDHYLWDIQQGQLLLWILFALIVSQRQSEIRVGK